MPAMIHGEAYKYFKMPVHGTDEHRYNQYLGNHINKQNKGQRCQDSERQKTYRAEWTFQSKITNPEFASIEDAQKLADSLVERKIPLIWQSGDIRRVLRTNLSLRDQILILLSSLSSPVETNLLFRWTECSTRAYFNKILRGLHSSRYVELASNESTVELLPPGLIYVDQLIIKLT